MLIGADISHWNGEFIQPCGNFIIIKATEGCTFIDPQLTNNLNKWINTDQSLNKLALYHFARPDINKVAEQEAIAFLQVIEPFLKFNPILVLDWESSALNKKYNDWAKSFLDYIYFRTGYKPVIYTNTYGTNVLGKSCVEYPLWIASYQKKEPKFYNWKKWTFWQFTSTPFDLNLFNGDYEAWNKLTIKK